MWVLYSKISFQIHSNLLQKNLKRFDSILQNRINRFVRWEDTQLTLLGKLLFIRGINQVFDKDYTGFNYNKYGKPYAIDSSCYFNISHSNEYVICAISNVGELGVDIEYINNIDYLNYRDQMTKEEWRNIIIQGGNNFFKIWTRKEAVAKAVGKGLYVPLNEIDVLKSSTVINGKEYHIKTLDIINMYQCAIATEFKPKNITEIFIDPREFL